MSAALAGLIRKINVGLRVENVWICVPVRGRSGVDYVLVSQTVSDAASRKKKTVNKPVSCGSYKLLASGNRH